MVMVLVLLLVIVIIIIQVQLGKNKRTGHTLAACASHIGVTHPACLSCGQACSINCGRMW
jgi:hypothetical protein